MQSLAVTKQISFLEGSALPATHRKTLYRSSATSVKSTRAAYFPRRPVSPQPVIHPLPDWHVGLHDAPGENYRLPARIEGALPPELNNRTFYANGVGSFSVSNERNAYLFDGDGMVHAIDITSGDAFYSNRFVNTKARQREIYARRRLYAGFCTPHRGGLLGVSRGYLRKNSANTNVIYFGNKLLALCEAGLPHRLDPDSLATLGEDHLGGVLTERDTFSGHPKTHPTTGELWNFSLQMGLDLKVGMSGKISLLRCFTDGRAERFCDIDVPFACIMHDFSLSQRKAIFVFSPLCMPNVPHDLLLGRKSFLQSLTWKPHLGTHICVVDLHDKSVVRSWLDKPIFSMHSINAWDDAQGGVTTSLVSYSNADVLQVPEMLMRGVDPGQQHGHVSELHIDASGTASHQVVSETSIEFPRIHPAWEGRKNDKVYCTAASERAYSSAPSCLDLTTGNLDQARLPKGHYAAECVAVPKSQGKSENAAWVSSLVLIAPERRSELQIYDGAALSNGPVCTISLPLVPYTFHANWR